MNFTEYNRREALYEKYSSNKDGEKIYKNFHLYEKVTMLKPFKGAECIIFSLKEERISVMTDASHDYEIISFGRKDFDNSIKKKKQQPNTMKMYKYYK